MEYFNHGIFSFSKRQVDGRKINVRNSGRSEENLQTGKCQRRNVLTHFLSLKICAALSFVVICVILQIFQLYKDNGEIRYGFNFGNIHGRNLSQNNANNRPGGKRWNTERNHKDKETFLNSPHVEGKGKSGRCRYEELETVLGGSYDFNGSDNITYYVSLPEDDSQEDSEDEWETESEGGEPDALGEEFEDFDEEYVGDDVYYEEIEILSSQKDVSSSAKTKKWDETEFIPLDIDESLAEDSDADSETKEMLTEEELYRRIKGLRGNLDGAELLYLWNSFEEIENSKLEDMQRQLWELCELLGIEYNIPEDALLKQWKRIVDFSSDELMKMTVRDYRDFKKFLNEGLKNNVDFVYFLNSKRGKWVDFRCKTKNVWKKCIDNIFKNYYK
ncbi:Plasmodium exported protein, unknown function [Plasmodium knowlesi strain H]|uniref:Plasmodium RESA N-terminal domain-containing protein n=3 Tax=Plasmodium knowlesi TaxID=5850 RepID=A0A5K1UHV6_PLAKH|nr:Plasmodium exported protein (PHISTc), unknown function [Plasmodium knowlesi strain H]OTN67947.1 Uncharacterized protein PKNOH_S04340400 [Plasmodium knowlesi]CAA9990280.1 Plasmodium exported protein (PHISTc), unknown function [Plasmodium knowlesi strain H]SBO26740.1 Plasmodium exported protein, unknown function [Plasmodium knowlesi strain H]SBO28399.1 Plasmodium exported protein, unknown function [Plasmodium knowlesi strain H]VVS79754.1 Plasmodium exported protein (PHISTc), unknown function |eukprot:XP_002258021.1 hypothetical protein, conserved in Plasmodium species [Plasmodium knowlesi strain H]